jgi:hypothetical protein
MEEGLDKHGSDVGGTHIRDEGANLGPGAVRANQNLSGCRRVVGKGQHVLSATQPGNGFELVSPADCIGRQRLHEHLAQVSPVNLWTLAVSRAGPIEEDIVVLIDYPFRIFAGPDDVAEFVEKARRFERALAIMFVEIEPAALRACGRRGLGLIDCCPDAVDMQDPR